MADAFQALESFLMTSQVIWGYADVAGIFPDYPQYPRAVSLAYPLPTAALVNLVTGPTQQYYTAYCEANAFLNVLASQVCAALQGLGYPSLGFPATVSQQQLERATGSDYLAKLAHKTIATRAGLGWIGKNALLVTKKYGPRVRLASVLTTAPLPIAQPITTALCGSCQACVKACPAGALHGASWQVGVTRQELVDVHACARTAHALLMQRTGQDDTVCGICVAVCPFGKKQQVKR
ncbi:MAG: epoxyqueuosine reductase [Chloroflexi bacterium]|nr:epoxyqueuosine reductase [Chloroflexota bacterium]